MADIVLEFLLRHLFREAMLVGEVPPGKLRTLLVIDEAKLQALRGKNDPLGVLNRLATEARKYGLEAAKRRGDEEIEVESGGCRRRGVPGPGRPAWAPPTESGSR